jgi:hypothetical protein
MAMNPAQRSRLAFGAMPSVFADMMMGVLGVVVGCGEKFDADRQ